MTTKPPSKKTIAEQLRKARYACERVCDQHWQDRAHPDHPRNNQAAFRDLVEEITRLEREHMRFGSRLLGHRPARKSTTATRIAYFVVMLLATEKHPRRTVEAFAEIRRDWQIASLIQRAIGRKVFRDAVKEAGCDLAFLDAIDYAGDLA